MPIAELDERLELLGDQFRCPVVRKPRLGAVAIEGRVPDPRGFGNPVSDEDRADRRSALDLLGISADGVAVLEQDAFLPPNGVHDAGGQAASKVVHVGELGDQPERHFLTTAADEDREVLLGTAEATVRGALAREETRGAHNRSDFPELDPAMEVNFIVRRGSQAQMTLEPAPVPAVSVELTSWLARAGDLDPAGRLLE